MPMDDFRKQLEAMLRRSEEENRRRETLRAEEESRYEQMLLDFDAYADRLQEDVVAPRIRHLASLFPHAVEPRMVEEEDYRHRIHLHFAHTAEFPCTADVTVLIAHGKVAGEARLKFEFLILPAYVTERFKGSEEATIPMDDGGRETTAAFVEGNVAAFLEQYLKARVL